MASRIRPLVIIEAPGKSRRLRCLLAEAGLAAEVWATRGYLRQNPSSLWPLAINRRLVETARVADPQRLRELQTLATGRDVIVATDPDQEGEVIARDVAEAVSGVARTVRRVYLHALDGEGIRAAFARTEPVRPGRAIPGDARRVIDRLIGSTFSAPGRPVGRVFTALLGQLLDDPVIGHVTLVAPAADGGSPFVARVPVTVKTRGVWEARLREWRGLTPTPLSVASRGTAHGVAWRYGDYLTMAAGAPLTPAQMRMQVGP